MSGTPPLSRLSPTRNPFLGNNRANNHVHVTILPDNNDQTQDLCDPCGSGGRGRTRVVHEEIAVVRYDHHLHDQFPFSHQDEDDEDNDCDTDTDMETNDTAVKLKPLNHFRWLERDTSIKLNLSGSSSSDSVESVNAWTDWAPRIEIESVPSGRTYHHNTCVKREEKSGRLIPDQKLFYLLNSRNQRLLVIDYSTDLKSFHVMEPDSQRFIAFFTLPAFPCEENEMLHPIYIHNVIDGEMYVVDPFANDLTIPIRAESGEELAVIMRPPPKWTQSQPGLMTLHFTGDERDGLTCRERAIILGFFLSLGIQGISHWKRSSLGILAIYVLSALLGCCFVLFVYVAFRTEYAPLPTTVARQHFEEQQQQEHAILLLQSGPASIPTIKTTTTSTSVTSTAAGGSHAANFNASSAMSMIMSVLTSPPDSPDSPT